MYYSCFVINKRPVCFWDPDLPEVNKEFIKGIKAEYYQYIARDQLQNLESDHSQFAAILLRTTYAQGLESFFSLLCSTLQAPNCVVGWLLNYRPSELFSLIEDIQQELPIKTLFRLDKITWLEISKLINQFPTLNEEDNEKLQREFSLLWESYARDLLDESFRSEYNSFKHGLRLTPGGFSFSAGLQDNPDTPAPPDRMKKIFGSKFGSSYYVQYEIDEKECKKKINFGLNEYFMNWNPMDLVLKLKFLTTSITNVVAFLILSLSKGEKLVNQKVPIDDDLFCESWKKGIHQHLMKVDFKIKIDDIKPFEGDEILKMYE